jgi:hypothetical protein
MNNLLIVMSTSLVLFGCTATNIENFDNIKSKHEQKIEKLHKEVHRTETIIKDNHRKQNYKYNEF